MPSITGGIVLVSSRILLPIDLATVRDNVVITSTILGTLRPLESVATVGSILAGNVTASISDGRITASISGGVLNPSTPVFATTSATVRGESGTLYGVIAAAEVSAGTLLLLHSGGARLIQMIVPANDTGIMTTPYGILFTGSLIASIMGTMAVTFML
ncbi:MAG: hypothetical protein QXW52_09185 [Candidatus Caldarchaeum sp.]